MCKHEGQKGKGGAKRGQNCYVTPTFSGVTNAKHGEQIQKRIVSPPRAGGAKSEVAHKWARWLLGNLVQNFFFSSF